VPQLTSTRVAGYRRSPKGRNDAQLFAQSRTLRIRQTVGLDLSIARSTSPLQPLAILLLSYFHKVSRAAGPTTTNLKLSEGGHWIASVVFGERDVKLSRSRLRGHHRLISPKPVSGQSSNVDSSIATSAFAGTNRTDEPITSASNRRVETEAPETRQNVCGLCSIRPKDMRQFGEAMRGIRQKAAGRARG